MPSQGMPPPDQEVPDGRPMEDSQDGALTISLLGVANFILRHRVLILALPLVTVAVALAVGASLETREFAARSTFLAQAGEGGDSRLAGLASQLGVRTASPGGNSPSFYITLLRSRRVLSAAAAAPVEVPTAAGGVRTTDLSELFEVEGDSPQARQRATVGLLRDKVDVSLDASTGIISLETRAPTPEGAVQVNRLLLELMDEFNRERRQTESKEERRFVEARLNEARQELVAAEKELESFLERNRYYEGSPQLMLEANRLNRQVDLRQQLYSTLAVAYEQARIEEVRYTPVITVIDEPEGSVSRTGQRSWVMLGVLALLFGLVLAIAAAAVSEYIAWQRRQNPREFAEFQRLTASLRGRFRRGGAGSSGARQEV